MSLDVLINLPPDSQPANVYDLFVEKNPESISILYRAVQTHLASGYILVGWNNNIPIKKLEKKLWVYAHNHQLNEIGINKVTLIETSPIASILPQKFNIDDYAIDNFNLQFPEIGATQSIKTDIQNTQIAVTYTSDTYQNLLSALYIPEQKLASVRHLYSLQDTPATLQPNGVYVTILNNRMQIAAYKNYNLQITQSLIFENTTDVSYHIINVCKRFALDIIETDIIMSGMIDRGDELFHALTQYFPKIFFQPTEQQSIGSTLQQIPPHKIAHSLYRSLCVL